MAIWLYIWVNYPILLTWIKAIWGWFPLFTMIPVRSQWSSYNLPKYIQVKLQLTEDRPLMSRSKKWWASLLGEVLRPLMIEPPVPKKEDQNRLGISVWKYYLHLDAPKSHSANHPSVARMGTDCKLSPAKHVQRSDNMHAAYVNPAYFMKDLPWQTQTSW